MKTVCIVLGIAAVVIVLVVLGRGSGSGRTTAMPKDATDEDVRALAEEGRKIEAIKLYRTLHGVGLKEAKDAVDEMAAKP